jgi:ABC-2 type transport system permease protein
VRAFWAQLRTEVTLTLRNKESLLLTLGIPVGLLVFFSTVDVLPLDTVLAPGEDPVQILAPGVLALAILSMAMTGLAIATGFERSYGFLKRLGATPLGRPRLLAAKIAGVVAIEVVQAAVLVPVALALGWEPSLHLLPLLGAVVLGTAAFAGLGLWMAGTLRAEITLALANGLFVVALLLGGFVIPLGELPGALRTVAEALPASALADLVRAAFAGETGPARAWLVLALWAVATPLAAARSFRWAPPR